MSFISDPLLRCSNDAHNAKAAREKAAREWIIINALEAFGPYVSLRELGRKTNIGLSTLSEDLRRLVAAGVIVRETMPLKYHAKSPRYVWSLKG
jgi:DNA-binding Lrp family transcriptional regulator